MEIEECYSQMRIQMELVKCNCKAFLDELTSGLKYSAFIDDTGSPGLRSGRLHPERKSWVGVVVPPDQMPEVVEQCPEAVEELHRITGAEEFHFTDIYAGKGEFKGLDLQVRLSLFRFMAEIFQIYEFPVFVQTLDPISLDDIQRHGGFPDRVGPFNLRKHDDMALLFLLIRIKQYIEGHRKAPSEVARVFADEGYKRYGTAIHIPAWNYVFADGLICFARSSSIYPIQLADFAAYALNRQQLLLNKKKLSDLDKELLVILSKIAWNYQNIEKRKIQLQEL